MYRCCFDSPDTDACIKDCMTGKFPASSYFLSDDLVHGTGHVPKKSIQKDTTRVTMEIKSIDTNIYLVTLPNALQNYSYTVYASNAHTQYHQTVECNLKRTSKTFCFTIDGEKKPMNQCLVTVRDLDTEKEYFAFAPCDTPTPTPSPDFYGWRNPIANKLSSNEDDNETTSKIEGFNINNPSTIHFSPFSLTNTIPSPSQHTPIKHGVSTMTGMSTRKHSKNPNMQLRDEPPCPAVKVSPWMNTSNSPDSTKFLSSDVDFKLVTGYNLVGSKDIVDNCATVPGHAENSMADIRSILNKSNIADMIGLPPLSPESESDTDISLNPIICEQCEAKSFTKCLCKEYEEFMTELNNLDSVPTVQEKESNTSNDSTQTKPEEKSAPDYLIQFFNNTILPALSKANNNQSIDVATSDIFTHILKSILQPNIHTTEPKQNPATDAIETPTTTPTTPATTTPAKSPSLQDFIHINDDRVHI